MKITTKNSNKCTPEQESQIRADVHNLLTHVDVRLKQGGLGAFLYETKN